MKKFLTSAWQDIVAIVVFLLISFAYFQTPISQGLVLGGHDSDAAVGQGHEQQEYRAAHDGETTRWTNSMFSGMPTFQMAPSYSATDTLSQVSRVYNLGTTGVLCYVFAFLLGFYVMMRAFNFRPWLAALGAIVWAFSSYFFIIIAAGHIWKVMTLAYIPPTIGGLVLCYRGRWLWGGAVTALFTAFQVLSNHVQMTYYFLFVMLFIVVAYGIQAFRGQKANSLEPDALSAGAFNLTPSRWLRATGVVIIAGLLGVAANLPNLYHTYDYAQHTMRGGCELTPLPSATNKADAASDAKAEASSGGLDYDYITQWSYGIDETMTLLIPDFKGGGSGSAINDENYYDEPQQELLQYVQTVYPAAGEATPGINQYWGDQPFTVGPVYVGAFIVFLFILGLFVVRGPLKWGLIAATVVSLLFAWGHNVPAVTHFLIDHLPMYNKFRTVSSALVIAEFTMPLLALLALAEVLRSRNIFATRRGKIGLGVATVLTVGVCLVLWIAPSIAGDCISLNEADAMTVLSSKFDSTFISGYTAAITSMRHAVLASSAARSLGVLLLGGAILFAGWRVREKSPWTAPATCLALALLALLDMWSINRRYLNDNNFSDPVVRQEQFGKKSSADELILRDSSYYRVLDLSVNTFNDNTTSYWHHNIGGYHAAKLQRYQDIIERQLARTDSLGEINQLYRNIALPEGSEYAVVTRDSICPVLNMLNMKYVILASQGGGDKIVARNDYANGNGWFVSSLKFVKGADTEMAALTGLDTKHAAVADEQFRAQLDGSPLGAGTVKFLHYEANELQYEISSDKGGLVVFSEVYYPGWTATIDGQDAELGRVNYILRALKVPAGQHKVVLTFRPASVTTTNGIAYAALAVILLFFLGALAMTVRGLLKKDTEVEVKKEVK